METRWLCVTRDAAIGRHGCRGVSSTSSARTTSPRRGIVRVCIVYEHSLFAHGIKRLLEPQKTLRIVGLIERQELSTHHLRRLRPDVVVVEGNGGMAIMESLGGVTALAISLRGDEATILSGLPVRVGAPEELAGAIRDAARQRSGRRRKATR